MRRSIWNENDRGGHQWVNLKNQSLAGHLVNGLIVPLCAH